MKYIVRALTYALIPVIVGGVLALLRQPKKAEEGKVRHPLFTGILGLVCATLFLIPTLITAFSDESIWIPLIFFAFSSLGLFLFFIYLNCRITYDDNGFTVKNLFGVKKSYTYDEITNLREDMSEDVLFVGGRKISVERISVGGFEFIAFAKKKYKQLHSGQGIPKAKRSKLDLFNGNIRDAESFLLVYVILGILVIVCLIFALYFTFTTYSPENTVKQEVLFSSFADEGDEIVLTSKDGEIYKIRFFDDAFDASAIEKICNGKTTMTVYVEEISPDDEEPYFFVYAIARHNNYLLSFDQTNAWHRKEYAPLIPITVVLLLLFASAIVGSVIVGRNPKKYKKWVVRLFFKDSSVKW